MAEKTVELKRHYRIGEKICEYADQILPPKAGQAPLLESCNYLERLRSSSLEVLLFFYIFYIFFFKKKKKKKYYRARSKRARG